MTQLSHEEYQKRRGAIIHDLYMSERFSDPYKAIDDLVLAVIGETPYTLGRDAPSRETVAVIGKQYEQRCIVNGGKEQV